MNKFAALNIENQSIAIPKRDLGDYPNNELLLELQIRQCELVSQKEQFVKLFNLAPELLCIATPNGFFKKVNPAFTQTLGFSKNELLVKTFMEFVVPEDVQPTLEILSKLQNGEQILNFENRYLCKDNSFRWLSWNAAFDSTEQLIYAAARDVTESKKAQEKLQLAEMVYQNCIEAVVVANDANEIISVNPAFTKITGYTQEDVLGKNPRIFQSGLHDKAFYQAMWQSILSEGNWQGEITDKRKNGDLHVKYLHINAIRNENSQVYRYLALFTDVTKYEHHEQIAELNKAKLAAEEASRAKSDFLSSMSHELRTPMNAVLGFAQLLELEDLTEDQREYVGAILASSKHLLGLITKVLSLAKIETTKIEHLPDKVELNFVVHECISWVQSLTLENNVKIIDNITTTSKFTVFVHQPSFKQALHNLVLNAIKYNRVDGTVCLSYELVSPQTLRINVTDTGKGLSEVQLSKLFVAFERLNAKNSHIGGTGIGLYLSKKLIESMNGAIGADSTVGVGSCFWIELPLVEICHQAEIARRAQ